VSHDHEVHELAEAIRDDGKLRHHENEHMLRAVSALGQRIQGNAQAVLRLVEAIAAATPHPDAGCLDLRVIAVGTNQEVPPMTPAATDHSPDFKLNSANDYAVPASVGSKKVDGTYLKGSDVTWTSDDPANQPIALPDGILTVSDPAWVDPGDGSVAPQIPKLDVDGNQVPILSARVNTPGDNGNVLVTLAADGMASRDQRIIWSTPVQGHFSDLVATELPEESTGGAAARAANRTPGR